MYKFSNSHLSFFFSLFLILTYTTIISDAAINWTNGDFNMVYNGPDKPTKVTFNDCVKVLSISTYHWNYGKGDTPGRISFFHEDGTSYGPWDSFGVNGTSGVSNVNWFSRPGETLKAGTYLVTDSNPATWSQNDNSDNRGIVSIVYEPDRCKNDFNKTPNSSDILNTNIPEEYSEGVTLKPAVTDPTTLPGGAVVSEKLPMIEQVNFTPLFRDVTGGQNVYAILRIKNIGYRDLEEGYVIIRFISPDGSFSYKGGMGKIPTITVGEERDIALIIPLVEPGVQKNSSNTLYCSEYRIDGSISELMNGGYFESRGLISLSRNNLISITGCCREPYTNSSIRGCEKPLTSASLTTNGNNFLSPSNSALVTG